MASGTDALSIRFHTEVVITQHTLARVPVPGAVLAVEVGLAVTHIAGGNVVIVTCT